VAAFDSAHELKGVLANMGLTPLWEDACALVEPLRVGKLTNTDANYAKLLADLSTFKEMLK
jgi:HPt (histidine-containing phosphotransfer) domain-containing protein